MNFIIQGINIECDRIRMPFKSRCRISRTELINQLYDFKTKLCRKSLWHITRTLHYFRYGYLLEVSTITSNKVVSYLFWYENEDSLNRENRKVFELWEKQ